MSKEITTRIRILLLERGVTQAQIARDAEITTAAVNHVVSGYRKHPGIRRAIAKACGVPVEDLWPEEANRPEDPRCKWCPRGKDACNQPQAV